MLSFEWKGCEDKDNKHSHKKGQLDAVRCADLFLVVGALVVGHLHLRAERVCRTQLERASLIVAALAPEVQRRGA